MHKPSVPRNDERFRGRRAITLWRLLPAVLLIVAITLSRPVQAASPVGGTGFDKTPTSVEPEDPPQKPAIPKVGYRYIVQPGDDIWLIAVAHGLNMEELAAINGLKAPYWLHPGDKLWVPAKPAVVKHPPTPQKKPAPAVAAATQAAPPVDANAQVTGTVAAPPAEAAAVVTTTVETTGEAAPPAPVAEAPAEESATNAAAAQPLAEDGLSEGAALIFAAINQKRAAYGLPALVWSPELAQAAQAHAEDCARRGWGSHIGSDGARLRTRYARVGYGAVWASENWANARGPQQAFDMWWYEPPGADPHRQNILGPNYTEIGIGIAQGGWGYYYVADFGSR